MHILDMDADRSVNNIIIYLTKKEADHLLHNLSNLVKWNNVKKHVHNSDDNYEHEITMVIYDENKLDSLNKRSKEIIKSDK